MIKIILVLAIIIFSSVFYGVIIGHYQIFPYDIIKQSKIFLNENSDDKVTTTEFYKFDVYSLVDIYDEGDVEEKRSLLIQYIWKNTSFPKNSDLVFEKKIIDLKYENLENLESIDKITIAMDHDVNSISYLFHSEIPNNNLVIYHEGHKGDFIHGSETIQKLLINGYDVLAFSMPLMGMNNQPIVDLPNFGKIKLSTHNHLRLLESEDFSPIKYFLEPITISLNYLDDEFDYQSYSMIGISGGGWTTTLYSAIDERISKSFSVAGSYPIYLRSEAKNLGDYEQTVPKLYAISNYLELYIMSSYGPNRLHIQFFNENDPCCFSGTAFESYDNLIKQKIDSLGQGNFEIYLDDTHNEHKISEYVLNRILSYI